MTGPTQLEDVDDTCCVCGTKISQGSPIALLSTQPFQRGHKGCVNKALKEQKEEENMVPRPPQHAQQEEPETVPEGGFVPDDFPRVFVHSIPYESHAFVAPDPKMTITKEGWLCVDTGGTRVAFPDRDSWDKFVRMGTRLWNSYEQSGGTEE